MRTVYNKCQSFVILGKEVYLSSEMIGQTRNTVAQISDQFHYLGNEPANIASAVFAWQDLNGRDLTEEEFRQVLIDNEIISQAI